MLPTRPARLACQLAKWPRKRRFTPAKERTPAKARAVAKLATTAAKAKTRVREKVAAQPTVVIRTPKQHLAASALDKCSGPEPVDRGDAAYNAAVVVAGPVS